MAPVFDRQWSKFSKTRSKTTSARIWWCTKWQLWVPRNEYRILTGKLLLALSFRNPQKCCPNCGPVKLLGDSAEKTSEGAGGLSGPWSIGTPVGEKKKQPKWTCVTNRKQWLEQPKWLLFTKNSGYLTIPTRQKTLKALQVSFHGWRCDPFHKYRGW